MPEKQAIVLCSGGLDSVTTAYLVKNKLKYNKLTLLFFDYSQNALNEEKQAVSFFSKELNVEVIEIKIPELGKLTNSLLTSKKTETKTLTKEDLKDTKEESAKYYLPARNLIFLSYAFSIAEAISKEENCQVDIFVGFKHEGKEFYPDTTPEFVKLMNTLSETSTETKPKVLAPLIDKDKEDIIQLATELNIKLEKTFSCHTPKYNKHCGICLACMLRKEGFRWANIKDITDYEQH